MANLATIKMPVLVEFAGKMHRVGELTIDVKMLPSGKLVAPSAREIRIALKKVT